MLLIYVIFYSILPSNTNSSIIKKLKFVEVYKVKKNNSNIKVYVSLIPVASSCCIDYGLYEHKLNMI